MSLSTASALCNVSWLLEQQGVHAVIVGLHQLCLQAQQAEKHRLEALLRDLTEIGKIQESHDLLLQVMAWEVVGIPSAVIHRHCLLAACAENAAGCLSA